MPAINDLIEQIPDVNLRERIRREVEKLSRQKKFGLVFESHLPEYIPLYDVPVKKGCKVMLRSNSDKAIYTVLKLTGSDAVCYKKENPEDPLTFKTDDIVRIAEFGEPIYPYLKPIDTVCNAPESDLWHTLIEADNYHALQLLEYLYAGKVDCIYIDPPYNTGARDWKYNNNYVDGNDAYRHSKWLSMMEKRLKIAKKLLNPNDSVLIVTIDEKEYLHLGCLLEELLPEAKMQMISSVINSAGVNRDGEFSRCNEFIFILRFGVACVEPMPLSDEWIVGKSESAAKKGIVWNQLRRSGTGDLRKDSPNLFYPIIFNKAGSKIISTGSVIPISEHPVSPLEEKDNQLWLWPIKESGVEGRWQLSQLELMDRVKKGYVKIGKRKDNTIPISYLKRGSINKLECGDVTIIGYDAVSGTVVTDASQYSHKFVPVSQWNISSHNATYFGSQLLNKILGEKRFDFPKSLYAVHDTIRFFVANKPNALILDFFAGSGTTLHAVNLLNTEDGGHRRCIMVTNNEVSESETKELKEKGYKPGDDEWEKYGIARYVTWPRTVCSIEGHDINGQLPAGNYIGSDIPMADGFKANVAFYSLGFLEKTAVALGMRFKKILTLLWMKAGAVGPCPDIEGDIPDKLVLPKNKFAVLNNENAFADFEKELEQHPEIETVFIVTDYEVNYRSMVKNLNVRNTYQLYRDYLDNFRINNRRD